MKQKSKRAVFFKDIAKQWNALSAEERNWWREKAEDVNKDVKHEMTKSHKIKRRRNLRTLKTTMKTKNTRSCQ